MKQVHVTVSDGVEGLDAAVRRELRRRLRRMVLASGCSDEVFDQLSVRIVEDDEMSALHEAHMGLSGPTDVLSFPADDPNHAPETAGFGDVAIDWDQVRRQARGEGPGAWLDEATVLAVHGFTHLLGHDHATPAEGRRMHQVERRLLRRLNVRDVPRPYGRGVA